MPNAVDDLPAQRVERDRAGSLLGRRVGVARVIEPLHLDEAPDDDGRAAGRRPRTRSSAGCSAGPAAACAAEASCASAAPTPPTDGVELVTGDCGAAGCGAAGRRGCALGVRAAAPVDARWLPHRAPGMVTVVGDGLDETVARRARRGSRWTGRRRRARGEPSSSRGRGRGRLGLGDGARPRGRAHHGDRAVRSHDEEGRVGVGHHAECSRGAGQSGRCLLVGDLDPQLLSQVAGVGVGGASVRAGAPRRPRRRC